MTTLQMDPGEILREYNAAVRKDQQITILAELNCCRPLDIALCLREQGAELTGTWRARLSAHDRAEARLADWLAAQRPEAQKADPLTAGMLGELLSRIPVDTIVRIMGPAGPATSVLFLERVDATGHSFVLELQREDV